MLKTQSILVIEDDDSWLEYCVAILAKEGLQVSAASNALDALPKLKAQPYDIVLTDHVAWAGSQSMTEAIKKLSPDTEVILMTARPSVEDAVCALRQGAADYLGKPFSMERLRGAIESCSGKRRSRQRDMGKHGMDILEEIVEDAFLKMLEQGAHGRLNPALVALLNRLMLDFRSRIPAEQTQPSYDPRINRLIAAGKSPERRQASSLGRYEIVKELGRGAMGLIYLGRDPRINRFVALKTLSPELLPDRWGNAELKKRFFLEAECAGKLDHPHIVKIFDAGEENGEAFIAMEYLEGRDLRPWTEAAGLLAPADALGYARQAAEALDYAHRQGIVHRDIKPANMMIVDKDRSLRITDFGIAGLIDAAETMPDVLGTPFYMSPERIGGRKVDGRADQFSLGVVLFELLTGHRPWQKRDSVENVLYEVANMPHVDILSIRPSLPKELAAVIDKTLSKSPESRFATCGELAEALSRIAL